MRTTRLLFPLLLGALSACSTGLPPAPPPQTPVRILGLNDVYVLDTLTDGTGGLARVATLRRRLADAGPTLFVVAGDILSPSLASKYFRGRQMVEGLNAAGVDYATFGNHEFELKRDTLVARIRESRFTWISSNCTETSDGEPLPGSRIVDTVRVGTHKVGIFGVTLPGSYPAWIRCSDPDSAAQMAVDSLTKLEVDLVVGLTHQTIEADYRLLQRDPRIDVIMGGHEHEAHDSLAGGRHVLKADANSRTAQLATLWGGKGRWRQEPRLLRVDRATPADPAVQTLVRSWGDSVARRLGAATIVGSASTPIDARDELQRRRQTRLGNLITDGMRRGTGADVALLNSGTLRLDDVIPAGPVSSWTLESIFLFADETRVVTVPLTGARLRDVLETGLRRIGGGPYPQVSGLQATVNPAGPAGSRLVGDLRRADGRVIGATDLLRVALPVYLACESGDGYMIPEAKSACADWTRAPRAVDLLIAEIRGPLGGELSGSAEDRLTEQARR